MFDKWEYEIPKNTAESDRILQDVLISLGVITSISIGFPAGCGGYDWDTGESVSLARTKLRWQQSPIVPRTPRGYLAADDFVVHIEPVLFPILKGDPTLTWELWNLDDTYSHELWLGINWLTKQELEAQLEEMKKLNMNIVQFASFFRNFFAVPGARP